MSNQTAHRIWLTFEQQEAAVERYLAGEGAPAIARSFGVCTNNILNAIRRRGHAVRSKVEALTKYSLDATAFDEVTPESAYWIGFLFADGSIYVKSGVQASPILTVGLANKDRGHLKKFLAFLKSDRPVYSGNSTIRGKTHAKATVSVSSVPLTESLGRYGMKLKSLDRVAPPQLIDSRDFWRGLVDGDGFVLPRKKSKLSVCGGLPLMKQFLLYFQNLGIGLNTNVRSQISDTLGQLKPKRLYTVTFACSTAVKAARHLYKDASVFLDRKMADAKAIGAV